MSLLDRLRAGVSAGLSAYLGYQSTTNDVASRNDHYDLLWLWWMGKWRNDPRFSALRRRDPALYRGTVQLWTDAARIISPYAQFVYPGSLSKNGDPLPDGSRGAIPLDPDTGGDQTDQRLVAAFSMQMNVWQWSQYKSLRPTMAAVMGDCLTELVEDLDHGVVMPELVDPRQVKDIEIDSVGNVKAYTIEYQVTQQEDKAYGRDRPAENYRYRKEIDGEAFRYFKDDKPFDYSGKGSVIENPHGFAPAVWDRHQIVFEETYGISALEKTLWQIQQLNSVLSHAMDYQRKQFSAPVGIKGATIGRRGGTITMPGGASTDGSPLTESDVDELRRQAAEDLTLIGMNEGGEFVTVNFDIGKTKELLQVVMDSALSENPEASLPEKLMEMTQLTAPGVMRAMAPVVGSIEAAQANYDPQTIKLLQMSTAIVGERLKRSDYPPDLVRSRPDRYDAFAPFDLSSFGRGLMECSIGTREMFKESDDERATRLILLGQVIETGDRWLMAQAGIPEEEVARMVGEQEKRRTEMASALSVAGAGTDAEQAQAQDQQSPQANGQDGAAP